MAVASYVRIGCAGSSQVQTHRTLSNQFNAYFTTSAYLGCENCFKSQLQILTYTNKQTIYPSLQGCKLRCILWPSHCVSSTFGKWRNARPMTRCFRGDSRAVWINIELINYWTLRFPHVPCGPNNDRLYKINGQAILFKNGLRWSHFKGLHQNEQKLLNLIGYIGYDILKTKI